MLRLTSSPDYIRTACRGSLHFTSRQVTCVCEQSRTMSKCMRRGNAILVAIQTFCECTRTQIFAIQTRRVASMTFIHLAPCKVHQLLVVCQVHRQWDGSFREDQWPCHDVQTVCYRLLTAEAWLQPQYSPCKVYTLFNGTGSGYCQSRGSSLWVLIPPAPHTRHCIPSSW